MSGDPIRVLHVDDDPEFVELAATFLEREDDRFAVETAPSAEEGLDRLADGAFDAVVSDYDMPRTDGLGFLDAVRDAYPDLPFVLFTGKGSEELASDAISAGVTDYLQKRRDPSQYELLANRVANAVESSRAERRASLQERQYRELFEQAPLMYVLFRDDGRDPVIEDCNDRFLRKLGFDREEVIGRSMLEIYTDDTIEKVYEGGGFDRARAGEFGLEERTLIANDGERIETLLRASPRLDENGDVIGVQTMYLDVTDRKQRERELELYETMLETVPDGVYALDEAFRYLAVNQGMADLTGYSREELIGSHASLVNDEESMAQARRDRERLTAGGIDDTMVVAEHPHRTADGDRVPTEVRFRALPPDDDGSFRGTAGVIRDVSEHRARERELRRYERIVNTMDEAACIYDADGRFVVANEYLAEFYGTTPEALEGETSTLVPQIRAEAAGDPYRELLDGSREEIRGELSGEFPGHGYEVLRYRLTPLVVDGSVEGVVGVAREVTEQRARERELERQNERLETFASVVSHDLRNPLNVAAGNVELARAACEDGAEHLDAVEGALDRMDALLEDLLTLAREPEAVEDPRPVDLAAVADAAWGTVQTAEATLVVEADRTVRADRGRLQQLLENLVRNAVDHGGGDVTVRVGALADGSGFFLADDGPGIPDGDRDRVFERGYSTADGGTGFGLAIVREIVEAHGWDVSVAESDEGGARFEITGVAGDR